MKRRQTVHCPRGDGERAAVLSHWHTVELFSTQSPPHPRESGVSELVAGRQPPWTAARTAAREALGSGRCWRHAVYLGPFALAEAYGLLAQVFPASERERYGPPVTGLAPLAALVVDEDGLVVEGSATLSSCAWAIGRVLDEGVAALSHGFPAAAGEFAAALRERAGERISVADLSELTAEALSVVGLTEALRPGPARVRTYHVDIRAAEEGGDGVLLNGFHALDLARVRGAVVRGDYGRALWSLLAPADEAAALPRHDLLSVGEKVSEAQEREWRRAPVGRWPAGDDHRLALGQQRAVNEVLARVGGIAGGVAAVNGPPGTGKTTTLRDLVAAVVTERALRLAELPDPAAAFGAPIAWGGRDERVVWPLRDHLAGGELVLGCATNAAAENVTAELPAAAAVAERHRAGADPLATLGTLVLAAWQRGALGPTAPAGPPTAWALIAASLGSRRRNSDFINAFWWGRLPTRGDDHPDQLALSTGHDTPAHPGLRRTLAALRNRPAAEVHAAWQSAVADLGTAAARVEEHRQEGRFDDSWAAARADLFVAALALHRALLFGAPGRCETNLRAAVELIGGRPPAGLSAEAARAAWHSLFLAVPLVSTTFASLPRLFGQLGREDLGWLLVDEAAQVAAPEVAGGVWRARRLVAVGDPRQLEPIVALPEAVEQGLRERDALADEWAPARASAQRLADRACPVGTYERGDGDRWIGLPLTAHRRCEEPMFTIVNRMAYGGRMVNETPRWPGPPLPPSGWLDVPGADRPAPEDRHWSFAEGERLQRVLTHLELRGTAPADILVLTPFRAVAEQLVPFARRHPGLACGTVHTAQGREADIVILVLGAGRAHPGALRWATATPNLLNVAVSRARRRLWVIGDRAAWAPLEYAAVLAETLPVSRNGGR